MASNGEFPQALQMFCKENGVPTTLVFDPSGEQSSKEVKKYCNDVALPLCLLEEGTQHADLSKRYIGLFKTAIATDLRWTGCPLWLWDYCAKWRMKVHNFTANKRFKLKGLNLYYHSVGEEGDISHLCVFDFFSFVMYQDQTQTFPDEKWCLGICLGLADKYGNVMLQWVLTLNMIPVIHKTVRVLSEEEKATPGIINWKAKMLQNAYKRFGKCLPLCSNPSKNLQSEYLELYWEALTKGSKENKLAIPASCSNPVLENDAVESPINMLINAEVMLPSVNNDGTSVLF